MIMPRAKVLDRGELCCGKVCGASRVGIGSEVTTFFEGTTVERGVTFGMWL